ncbi:ankyrin repeat domain-containing protein [Candidatus Dependentiae bacterium]|nr:ankyrin repeat domain-containing protein [Candidatus Dependentiae bacterium]
MKKYLLLLLFAGTIHNCFSMNKNEEFLRQQADYNKKKKEEQQAYSEALLYYHTSPNTTLKDQTVQTMLSTRLLQNLAVNTMTEDQKTQALFNAILNKDSKKIQELIDAKVNVNKTRDEDATPLHLVVSLEPNPQDTFPLKVARMLITAGANINVPNKIGRTPLHLAVRSADMTMIDLLMEAGANPLYKDKNGITAFTLAEKLFKPTNVSKYTRIAQLLKNPNYKKAYSAIALEKAQSPEGYALPDLPLDVRRIIANQAFDKSVSKK